MTKRAVGVVAALLLSGALGVACAAGTHPQGYLTRAGNPVGTDGHPQDNNALVDPGAAAVPDAGLTDTPSTPVRN